MHPASGNDLKTFLFHRTAFLCVSRFLRLASFGTVNALMTVISVTFQPLSSVIPKILVKFAFAKHEYVMESFSELIKARRSMRKFTEEELTQEQVVTLMKAALMAPTSKRSNAWQFIVVDEKDKLKELSYCKEQASQFIADAALAVVVVADPLASDVWIEDASIASIYLQLQAEDMGLGSCWVQVRERFTASGMPSGEYVHEVLDIPLQLQVLSVIAIGHKGMERKPFNEDNLQWEKIHINKYGGK